jgi:hypothetical protein
MSVGSFGGKAYKLQYADIMKAWRPVLTDISVSIGNTGERKLTQYSKQRYLCQKGKSTYTKSRGPQSWHCFNDQVLLHLYAKGKVAHHAMKTYGGVDVFVCSIFY